MLRVANRIIDEEDEDILVAFSSPPAQAPVAILASTSPPSRYGQSSKPNWPVIALIVVIHAVLIMAIMHVRHQVQRREEARLAVVNLTPPPEPPPPASDTPPPPRSEPQIVAPAPVVKLLAPPPQIATTPVPPPVAINVPVVNKPAPPAPIAAASPPSTVQGGDLSAQMVSGKPPRYPIESRRKREQGTVVLALTVGTDGAAESISIARSSGFSRLDDAARDAVRKWRWCPLMQQGQVVRVKGVVEIPFVLQGATA